jgi:hypothetical protein
VDESIRSQEVYQQIGCAAALDLAVIVRGADTARLSLVPESIRPLALSANADSPRSDRRPAPHAGHDLMRSDRD